MFPSVCRGLIKLLTVSVKPNSSGNFRNVHAVCRSLSSDSDNNYDPYKTLELEPGASLKEIRNKYMKLSKKYHPDYNPGSEEAEQKFVSVTKAYRVLVDTAQTDISGRHGKDVPRKAAYDFTVEPLGIETEKLVLTSLKKQFLKVSLAAIAFVIAVAGLGVIVETVSESLQEWKIEKNVHQREKILMEANRQALLKHYQNQEQLKELYKKASSK